MFKNLCVVIIAFLLLYDVVEGKKTKKTKRPKPEEDNVPQPDVVSYSTFGFNDVGTYEGFVPSSPDYTRLLTGASQDTATKQLSSSYPTATSQGATGYGNNFGTQAADGQSFAVSNDGNSEPGYVQYSQNFNGFFNTPSFDTDFAQLKNAPAEEIYSSNNDEFNSPIYGTKLSSRHKFGNQTNHTVIDYSELNDNKHQNKFNPFNFKSEQSKPENTHNEVSNRFQNNPTYPATSLADFPKTASEDIPNPFIFPRVVDFTKMKPYFPTEVDTTQFPLATPRPEAYETPASALGNNIFSNLYNENSNNNKLAVPASTFKEMYNQKNREDESEKDVKSYTYDAKNNIYSYKSNADEKPNVHEKKPGYESKNKLKNKPWSSEGYTYKKWKDPSSVKGYEYSTNFSNMSFRYGDDEPKKPFSGSSFDEIVPASSNTDFSKYQFPEMEYTKFKKIPGYRVREEGEFDSFNPFKETLKPDFNQYKQLFSPESTANWGNSYKSSDSTLKKNPIKHQFNDINEEIVNIQPRRPNKFSYGKTHESKPSEWSQFSRRPSKKPWNDWPKEVSHKFKSEEDLLGLRNHDTSLPSYLPTYQSSNNYDSDEQDYKKLVEKWRQSYLKSKYKESLRDYETYASETKPMHVPVPKPYPIEVPHPIIVPVPQPYLLQVPVAKPVAVPVIREITIPIEKPVPYPVYKKVPYPIEKLVPVPVEKEVAVPVVKPYPVHVPHVRPVFHHTKSRDEYDSDVREEEDYFPRPENSKKVQYQKKKPYSSGSRDRPRRPSRTTYQDRNRRRWPDHRRPSGYREQSRRPPQSSNGHRDFDSDAYDEQRREYFLYCKKRGNC